MSIFKKVEEFNRDIVGIRQPTIAPLDPETQVWLVNCLHEEASELYTAESIVDMIDACIDVIYFAAGGLTRMGIPAEVSELLFDVVHRANMTKHRGIKEARETQIEADAVKPSGWVAPEGSIRKILQEAAMRRPASSKPVEY